MHPSATPRRDEGPAVLERVAEYRRATRVAVRSERPLRDRLLALLDLAAAARDEKDPTVRSWAERGIWAEAAPLLEDREVLPSQDRVEVAARSLRAKGYAGCPTCARPLHDEMDFARWRTLRAAWLDEAQAREGAVP